MVYAELLGKESSKGWNGMTKQDPGQTGDRQDAPPNACRSAGHVAMAHSATDVRICQREAVAPHHRRQNEQDKTGTSEMPSRRKTACFICSVHNATDPRMFYKEAVGLAQAGWHVVFLHRGEVEGLKDGVNVVALPRRHRFWRMLVATSMAWRSARYHADIYYIPNSELLVGGLLLQMVRAKRVVYDCHEDMVSFIRMKRYLPGPTRKLVAWVVGRLEHLASRKFSGFITADPAMYEAFPKLDESRRMIFYNVPLRSLFAEDPPPMHERQYDLVLVGTMSDTSGFQDTVAMMDRLWGGGHQVKVLLIGDPIPELANRISDLARAHKCDDLLTITGRILHTDVPARVAEARIGLIPLPDVPKFRKNIPTKFFEYLAAGCAVMATRLPPVKQFFNPGRHGTLVTAGNPDAWAEAVIDMLGDTDRLNTWSRYGREDFLEKYSAENEQEKLDRFLSSLIERPAR